MTGPTPTGAPVNILAVDDQPAGRFAIESVLRDIANVVTVRSGRDALRQLLHHEFAVILLDVQMPDMDGYETATAIRERSSTRHTPIIFLTASHHADVHVFRGYAVGAVDYMLKPLDPDILRSKVSVFVELAKQSALIRTQSEQLARREREAREASRIKSEFLASMSHELRTPLNAIIGFTQLIHDGKVGSVSDEQREYLGDILSSSQHLLRLINDVLDLAKVEAGKLELHPEPVDVARLVAEVRDVLRALAARKLIRIETHVDPAVTNVVADPGKLKQLLYNYVSNAVKFTADAGSVAIRVLPEGPDRFRIEVQDTGAGIQPQDIPRLFVEFEQVQSSAQRQQAGTGLGLALTKRIVEAQGGEVGVRSTPGVGSTFFAVLPRRPTADPQREPEQVAATRPVPSQPALPANERALAPILGKPCP